MLIMRFAVAAHDRFNTFTSEFNQVDRLSRRRGIDADGWYSTGIAGIRIAVYPANSTNVKRVFQSSV